MILHGQHYMHTYSNIVLSMDCRKIGAGLWFPPGIAGNLCHNSSFASLISDLGVLRAVSQTFSHFSLHMQWVLLILICIFPKESQIWLSHVLWWIGCNHLFLVPGSPKPQAAPAATSCSSPNWLPFV